APVPFETVSFFTPVATLVTTMLAPGATPPDASWTTPPSEDLVTAPCAKTRASMRQTKASVTQNRARLRRSVRMSPPPKSWRMLRLRRRFGHEFLVVRARLIHGLVEGVPLRVRTPPGALHPRP